MLQVTNLDDYRPGKEPAIPGSLRWACENAGPRTVVFRVSGTIALKQTLTIGEPYLTLAGQTAPGDGICLRDYGTHLLNTHDIIIRHLRFRPGDEVGRRLAAAGGGGWETDSLSAHGCRNVILDHCSASWGNDEVLSLTDCNDVTVQWCFITESLNQSTHAKSAHGFGGLAAYMRDGARISQHHNLWAFHRGRTPRPGSPTRGVGLLYDFRNNVVYQGGRGYSSEDDNIRMNYLSNYVGNTTPFAATPGVRMYQAGNLLNDRDIGWDDFAGWARPKGSFQRMGRAFAVAPITTQPAAEAARRVLEEAGAVLPRRDAVDARVVQQVRNRTGGLINRANEVGGWPALASAEPPADRDHDGMPDAWEVRHGLDPAKADGSSDADNDGYTNLEEFLNGTDPRRGEVGDPQGTQYPVTAKKNAHFSSTRQMVFGCATSDEAEFRAFAERAKALGATHVTITAEDLPPAWWEMTPPGDPYPAWVITNPGLLKIATPEALKPHIPPAHGEEVMRILEARCRILRELGLKAAFHTFEPQMLPERVFADHPAWRGPRVDHPLRSRTPRFASSISHPEVLKLYTEAMGRLLDRCPEIEILQMRTSDSGAGVDWSSSLYAGASGNRDYQNQTMADRVRGFLDALQRAASARGADLHLHLYNLRDKQQGAIVAALAPGMAVEEQEGPGGAPFKSEVGSLYSGLSLLYYRRPFAPACGIPWPVTFLDDLAEAAARKPRRLFVSIGDRHNLDLYLRIYEFFDRQTTNTPADRRSLLHQVAAAQVGEAKAGKLVEIWMALQVAEKLHRAIRGGGTVFILGGVHERWITRPLVPNPGRLTAAETAWWRPFQFQARGEAEANDLMDIQGFRLPEVNGGYDKVLTTLAQIGAAVAEASQGLEEILPHVAGRAADSCRLLRQRIAVFECLVNNATHVFEYQRTLDGRAVERSRPPAGANADERGKLDRIAAREIANIGRMIGLLAVEGEDALLDRAPRGGREYQRLLGHDILNQLRRKVATMEAHRGD